MSLQLIIQEIKVLGDLKVTKTITSEEEEQLVDEQRKFRVKIGKQQFISKQPGEFIGCNHLYFNEPFSYLYDHMSHILYIEIFCKHQYLDNSDLDKVLTAQVDLADLSTLHGDIIETHLYDINQREVGKMVLTIQTFKQAKGYSEKVSSKFFFQAVLSEYEKQIQATQAAKNIKNLIVNNTLADTLMTISTMTLICEKEDPDIFMRQGFILIRYGVAIKAFSSMLKITSKQNAHWENYLQFLKNEGVKFQFFFFHFDELGSIICKAKGQIKYVVFDETINLHTINLVDKRSNIYGVLMVKFDQKQVDKVIINNKVDKKVVVIEPMIQEQIQIFNRFKFDNKCNNHILSEKIWELEKKAEEEAEEKTKPLNPEQKKKMEEHSRFIKFLQKEMIKIEKELSRREHNDKKDDRKSMFLPTLEKKGHDSRVSPSGEDSYKRTNSTFSMNKKTKFPRI